MLSKKQLASIFAITLLINGSSAAEAAEDHQFEKLCEKVWEGYK